MIDRPLSRRQFASVAGSGLLCAAMSRASTGKLTAGDVVDRIKKNVGIPWNNKSYRDTFKIGGPDMPVGGIAATFMSTLDVLQRAAKAGRNMIVTHEPTFWNDADLTDGLTGDPVYRSKLAFAKGHNLVVWRFHDHWHARKPDGIFTGWNKALGWEQYVVGDRNKLTSWVLPPTTLLATATHVQRALNTRSMRIIGDPATPVVKVARGSHTLAGNMAVLPNVDCLLISEAREWESIEYVRDTILTGAKKGALILAHEIGEEAGMNECASWLRGFISEVPVEFISSGEPFWRP